MQGASDPFPGLYVSTTSLQSKVYTSGVCHNTDAESVSFIVLPGSSSLRTRLGAAIGDFGIVHYQNTLIYTTYADSGPSDKTGEGSVFAASANANKKNENKNTERNARGVRARARS